MMFVRPARERTEEDRAYVESSTQMIWRMWKELHIATGR